MNYKLLALDLDGTTLTSSQTILDQVKTEIDRIKERVIVLLVTGRHHTAAKPYHHELGLDTPVISCNGTYIYDYKLDSILKENSIPKSNAKKFLKLAKEHDLKLVMYVTDKMTFSNHDPVEYMIGLESWASKYPLSLKPNIERVDSFEAEIDLNKYIWKFVVEGDIEKINFFSELDFIKDLFSSEKSWSNRVDFANKGNTKGSSLAQYLKSIDILPSEVIAIGDNHNDISMIELAGLGVAMENSEELVKNAANITTLESNDGLGISEIISKYFK